MEIFPLMNDHNLDDLILNTIEPKNSKTKSFLTIVALLIVVLIVAIILTKIILKDPNADKIALEENNTELVSPELTLQSAAVAVPKKEEPELSNIIENAFKAPVPAPKISKQEEVPTKTESIEKPKATQEVDLKAKEEKLQQEYYTARKARIGKEKVAAEARAEKLAAEKLTAERVKAEQLAADKLIAEKAKQEKEAIKKQLPKVAKSVPSTIREKTKTRPTGKPVNVPKRKSAVSQTYYIQVGSFSKTPSGQFLKIIKNSGFNYKITSATSAGTKKLLIGPYKTRSSADTALVRVRDRINKSAFVVKR